MNWKISAATVAVVVALAGTAGAQGLFGLGKGAAVPEAQVSGGKLAAETAEAWPQVTEMIMGEATAPVEIIEYASFTCPHCAAFHEGPFKELKENYIDTGKVRFVYREVYFDKYGLWGSMMARCAGPVRFFGIADVLYKTQGDWVRAGGEQQIVEELRKVGRLAGMDDETMNACFADGENLQTLVQWYQSNAEEHGVRATPTFVIDGSTYSNMPFSDFAAVIEAQLAE